MYFTPNLIIKGKTNIQGKKRPILGRIYNLEEIRQGISFEPMIIKYEKMMEKGLEKAKGEGELP